MNWEIECPHQEYNPRPCGFQHCALTNYATARPKIISDAYTYFNCFIFYFGYISAVWGCHPLERTVRVTITSLIISFQERNNDMSVLSKQSGAGAALDSFRKPSKRILMKATCEYTFWSSLRSVAPRDTWTSHHTGCLKTFRTSQETHYVTATKTVHAV
jgi:hypothetical protein